jgi:hypothetical protein
MLGCKILKINAYVFWGKHWQELLKTQSRLARMKFTQKL